MTIAAIRYLGSKCRIIAISRYDFQSAAAKKFGATEIVSGRDYQQIYAQIAKLTDANIYSPTMSKQTIFGSKGPNIIFDSVASEESLDDDLRLIRCNGKLVLVGMGFTITKHVDWSLQMYKEIEIVGMMMYGMQTYQGQRLDSFELAIKLMAQNLEPFRGLVTHFFPVAQYKDAFNCVKNKRKFKSIKVVFTHK